MKKIYLNLVILYIMLALLFTSSALAVKSNLDSDGNNGHGNDADHCDESNPSGHCPKKVSEPSLSFIIEERPILCGDGLYC